MTRAQTCFACGQSLADDDRLLLMRSARREGHGEEHCSEACLRQTIRRRLEIRAAATSRRLRSFLMFVLLLVGAGNLWQHFHDRLWRLVRPPQPHSISFDPPEVPPERAPASGLILYGPPWPPSDADWLGTFSQAHWIYPLPGPTRRAPAIDGQILSAETSLSRATLCRQKGRCAVDLGGELWGEYVYAAHDGVVERIQRAAGDGRGGEHVRLSHFDGFVFTQYFHLAAVPRTLVPGARVKAGDLIGLLGDTGSTHAKRHLYFALSIWPARRLAEIYWDPTPLMATWPLRSPSHGTVAGFTPEKEVERAPHRRR